MNDTFTYIEGLCIYSRAEKDALFINKSKPHKNEFNMISELACEEVCVMRVYMFNLLVSKQVHSGIIRSTLWASYQIRKFAGCACAGDVFPATNFKRKPLANFKRKPLASDPGMPHGTCVTHIPWYMSGSLTRGGVETVPAFPAHAQLAFFCVSGKRSIAISIARSSVVMTLTK